MQKRVRSGSADADRADIYQSVTDRIIEAIEAGAGQWQMPWHVTNGSGVGPVNISSEKSYRGVNVLMLWCASMIEGYTSPVWGTYRQWQAEGAQVRRGEKSTSIVFYKALDRSAGGDSENEPAENDPRRTRFVARGFSVFNADQVDGFDHVPVRIDSEITRVEHVEGWIASLNPDVRHGGSKAFYSPIADYIQMPPLNSFKEIVPYYSTLLHELTHWSGHKSRCDRDLKGRFGDLHYAMEELVAELGAAFLCSALGLEVDPRPDHAQYIDYWLRVLKSDKRAIFTAASSAQRAVDWMHQQQPEDISDWVEVDEGDMDGSGAPPPSVDLVDRQGREHAHAAE